MVMILRNIGNIKYEGGLNWPPNCADHACLRARCPRTPRASIIGTIGYIHGKGSSTFPTHIETPATLCKSTRMVQQRAGLGRGDGIANDADDAGQRGRLLQGYVRKLNFSAFETGPL